jgi:hypothetical protein
MRTEKWRPLPLFALLAAACTDIPDPRVQMDTPPDDGETMQPLGPGDSPSGGGSGNRPSTDPPPGPSPPTPGVPGDPCRSQGTNCVADAGTSADAGTDIEIDAGPSARACEAGGQSFPDGAAVPSGDSCNSCGCTDGSVTCTEIACDPVFCAEFIEEPDGVCSRFPLDPCISQDPDCASALVPAEP